jgi:hypothetical protein
MAMQSIKLELHQEEIFMQLADRLTSFQLSTVTVPVES